MRTADYRVHHRDLFDAWFVRVEERSRLDVFGYKSTSDLRNLVPVMKNGKREVLVGEARRFVCDTCNKFSLSDGYMRKLHARIAHVTIALSYVWSWA